MAKAFVNLIYTYTCPVSGNYAKNYFFWLKPTEGTETVLQSGMAYYLSKGSKY